MSSLFSIFLLLSLLLLLSHCYSFLHHPYHWIRKQNRKKRRRFLLKYQLGKNTYDVVAGFQFYNCCRCSFPLTLTSPTTVTSPENGEVFYLKLRRGRHSVYDCGSLCLMVQ
ncbi:hypothetical protein M9H77_28022 [Catharanthus roseus]|uniref:Uncharacterized protein n=1 Tax=Catharanthus roseus TaxID=4058 RepID=A0ACC0AEJ1_CATRO|nr:hypothetical protein M9H77_28022 [Catharanthus roseus]